MFCSAAMRIRKANGQVRHTATTTRATKLLSPMSQKGSESVSPNWSCMTWLTMPPSRWSRKDQVMTAV
jgi:hypothetical protein